MSTLSIPVPVHLDEFIERMVKQGRAANKADVVRRALAKYAEDQAVQEVMEGMQELKEGKIIRGDLREILKKME